ncbi:TetR/AcrR family transcriptional regulator [Jiangella anatolica]|uniref:TetR family transcriptional regulator n=1 Tax=Jiangella anatolica TaxID=2670374 RepID=A0A2W2C300_9ACTN|nr:TetR/AcrR family transcriptional regulator [Jiangella anatolica]PZF82347.1 TetR family transcriptional regulator [Jiangella anatolica]
MVTSPPAPGARKSNARGIRGRARLLDSALRAFASRGFHGATTREIADDAGMSAAAAYAHFPTKESMLYELSLRGHTEALATIETAAGEDGPPVERLQRAMTAFSTWHARSHTTARVVQYEMAALTPEHAAEIATIRRRTQRIVTALIEEGMATGEFGDDDAHAAGLAILSMGIDVARWYRDDGAWSPDEIGARNGRWAVTMLGGRPA